MNLKYSKFLIFLNLFFCNGLSAFASDDAVVFDAPDGFEFGLAGAPAHLEDQLDDIWLDFAEDGGVAAYDNTENPSLRLNFGANQSRN